MTRRVKFGDAKIDLLALLAETVRWRAWIGA